MIFLLIVISVISVLSDLHSYLFEPSVGKSFFKKCIPFIFRGSPLLYELMVFIIH